MLACVSFAKIPYSYLPTRSADKRAVPERPAQTHNHRDRSRLEGWVSEMLSASIRRVAARNLLATLFGIAILSVIPRSGRAQEISGSARLRALVDEALARSPVVLAARSHWQAQTKVPIQASTLPDPEVSLQHFTVGSPQPFSGYESSDFYYTGFGVSQDIPGPGKLRLQQAEAQKDADYPKHRYEAAGGDVEG